MMRAPDYEGRFFFVLITAIGCLLAVALGFYVLIEPEPLNVSERDRIKLAVPTFDSFRDGPLDYAEAVARPLFWKGRRPVAEVAEASAADGQSSAAEAAKFEFLGSVKGGDAPRVLLRSGDTVVTLKEGEEIAGWKVAGVGKGEVLLQNGTQSLILPPRPDRSSIIRIEPVN